MHRSAEPHAFDNRAYPIALLLLCSGGIELKSNESSRQSDSPLEGLAAHHLTSKKGIHFLIGNTFFCGKKTVENMQGGCFS